MISIFSRKAQSELLSKIVVLLILLVLSGLAYSWGSGLIQAQGVRSEAEQMSAKLMEFNQKIIEVANAGNGSARFIDVSLKHGELRFEPGTQCNSSNEPYKNMIVYMVSSRDKFVDADTWSLSDPDNKNMLCTSAYENSTNGVLITRHYQEGDSHHNEYALWLRTLNQTTGSNLFSINLTTSGEDTALQFSTGRHQVRVESQGTIVAGSTSYTIVLVSSVG